MEHVRRRSRRDGVAVVTLVDRERRNAMTAPMVAEIVETFDALEASDERRRGRAHRRAARVLLRRRRVEPRCAGATPTPTIASAAVGRVDLRGLPPGAALAAADRRRRQRPRGRRGHEPRARVRRAHRRRVGPVRRPVPAHRPAPGRRAHVDARAGGRPAGRGRDGAVRRARRRRPRGRDRPRVELPSRRRVAPRGTRARGAARHASRRRCRRATKQTLREVPWQPTSTPRSRPRSNVRPGRSAKAGSTGRSNRLHHMFQLHVPRTQRTGHIRCSGYTLGVR